MKLPNPVTEALSLLEKAGFEAFVVGGCVRDTLLGKAPNDWDITTSALPEQILTVFSRYNTIPTGLKHGTITVVVDGTPLEITTYRVDGDYSDNRHPDKVEFTSKLRDDLCRRDFTVNAMAYHPNLGMVDHFSGLADLAAGRIVCVGDPQQRFTEDALRILRALRFSATLDFPIEKVTADAARSLAPLLRRVSAERTAEELKKLLCGKGVRRVLLEFRDILAVVLPELQATFDLQQANPYHHLTVYEHTVETVASSPSDPILRWTMLFHDCGKPACYTRDLQGVDHFRGHPAISAALAEQAMSRLRLDKHTITAVKALIMHHDDTLPLKDSVLLRLLNRLGPELSHDLVDVQRADVLGQHPDKRDRLEFLDQVDIRLQELARSSCYTLATLNVNGDDLQQLGFRPGRTMGDTLYRLLDEVMDGHLPNERTALLAKAKEWV